MKIRYKDGSEKITRSAAWGIQAGVLWWRCPVRRQVIRVPLDKIESVGDDPPK